MLNIIFALLQENQRDVPHYLQNLSTRGDIKRLMQLANGKGGFARGLIPPN